MYQPHKRRLVEYHHEHNVTLEQRETIMEDDDSDLDVEEPHDETVVGEKRKRDEKVLKIRNNVVLNNSLSGKKNRGKNNRSILDSPFVSNLSDPDRIDSPGSEILDEDEEFNRQSFSIFSRRKSPFLGNVKLPVLPEIPNSPMVVNCSQDSSSPVDSEILSGNEGTLFKGGSEGRSFIEENSLEKGYDSDIDGESDEEKPKVIIRKIIDDDDDESVIFDDSSQNDPSIIIDEEESVYFDEEIQKSVIFDEETQSSVYFDVKNDDDDDESVDLDSFSPTSNVKKGHVSFDVLQYVDEKTQDSVILDKDDESSAYSEDLKELDLTYNRTVPHTELLVDQTIPTEKKLMMMMDFSFSPKERAKPKVMKRLIKKVTLPSIIMDPFDDIEEALKEDQDQSDSDLDEDDKELEKFEYPEFSFGGGSSDSDLDGENNSDVQSIDLDEGNNSDVESICLDEGNNSDVQSICLDDEENNDDGLVIFGDENESDDGSEIFEDVREGVQNPINNFAPQQVIPLVPVPVEISLVDNTIAGKEENSDEDSDNYDEDGDYKIVEMEDDDIFESSVIQQNQNQPLLLPPLLQYVPPIMNEEVLLPPPISQTVDIQNLNLNPSSSQGYQFNEEDNDVVMKDKDNDVEMEDKEDDEHEVEDFVDNVLNSDTNSEIPGVPNPSQLKVELLRYQSQGVYWMIECEKKQNGGILADSVGLGKTITMFGLLLTKQTWPTRLDNETSQGRRGLKKNSQNEGGKPVLIITPPTLQYQWYSEIFSKIKGARQLRIHHYTKAKDKLRENQLKKQDIILTTQSRFQKNVDYFNLIRYSRIIVDEGHFMKNYNTKTAKALLSLKADWKWTLTGTPCQEIKDLLGLFKFINYTKYVTPRDFNNVFKKINNENDITKAQRVVRKVLLRRKKNERITGEMNLPRKKHRTVFVELDEIERKIYDRIMIKCKKKFRSIRSSKSYTKIKQLFEPLLWFLNSWECGKEHKNWIYDSGVDGLCEQLEELKSSKLDRIIELTREIIEEKNEKVIIGSGQKRFLAVLKKRLSEEDIEFAVIDTDIAVDKRQKQVDKFTNMDNLQVCVISTGTSKEGLNLQVANNAILAEQDINFKVEKQFAGRIHRLGQNKKCCVYRMIVQDSIEQEIMDMGEVKIHKLDNLETFEKLSVEDMKDLFRE